MKILRSYLKGLTIITSKIFITAAIVDFIKNLFYHKVTIRFVHFHGNLIDKNDEIRFEMSILFKKQYVFPKIMLFD